ncbi:Multidrug efflux pump subunit AcrB [Gracilibacillus ureilyticus]|uniref:Multidrug efflux pump subunit AcrB n=1 Tax=Gracilibacillus ureilyticus TaxID=531814 RepID=A0A1H9SW13_9BACI|nr:efflux RND transporter permease subunit [Gracilibacillus ureilyticus]SER89078.1 Multidrug efflux pump subunit AcrB [Gracilibacillus ureilyticus]
METLLKYKKIIWIFLLLLITIGIFTYIQLPKRDIPEISQNIASVTTVYPGANPEVVEKIITQPIEEKLINMDGVDQVTSASTNGFSTVTITLDDSKDSDAVYSSIRQSVQTLQSTFPDDVMTPEVTTDLVTSSVATYHLLSEERSSLFSLREEMTRWEEEITDINGVDSVEIKGLPEQKVVISLDQERLEEEKIQPNQVIEAVSAAFQPVALGTDTTNDHNFLLNLSEPEDMEKINSLFITKNDNNESIYLTDIGSVNVEAEPVTDIITYEEMAALSITVYAADGVNITSLQKQIDENIETLSENLPEEVTVDPFYSQSTIINEVYTSLLVSLAISFFAVIVIMILGLPMSSAIVVGLAIPVSIIIGLIPLPYTGVDLNQISIIGIIVAIGILVDDAIVVNDNITRRYQLGDNALEGAKRGVKEVGISIITSTLLIVFSFFPLTFLSGSNGEFIRALPIALMGTIIASTIIALTVIPSIQYTRQLKMQRTRKRRVGLLTGVFRWMEGFYSERVIPRMIKRPWLTAISGTIVCFLLLSLAIKVPFEFFPAADREEVTLSLTLDEGTSIEDTDEQLQAIESFILEQEEYVTETARYTGGGLPNIFNSSLSRSGENTGQIVFRVDRDNYSSSQFIEDYESTLRNEFTDGEIFLETIVSGPPPSPALEVKIQGPELEVLLESTTNLLEKMNNLESVELATANTGSSQPVQTYEIDRDFLADHGIPISQVKNTLQLANTGIPLEEIDYGEERLPLEITLDEGTDNGIGLEQLSTVVVSDEGRPAIYRFDQFITIDTEEQIAAITHLDGKRTITISVYEKEGNANFANETADVLSELEEELPANYQLIEDGEASAESEFFVEVAKLFIIVLFLIYLTLAVQFNSLLTPLLITGTIFLAVTGAIVGLFVSGQPLSFLAVLGIVSLSGIVVRNSILIIEFIEQNKQKSPNTIESAIIAAGKARLRPIILTTLTSIAALAPIIFTGDVLFKPLAVSIVAGLLFSTTLTLLLLPAFYLTIEKIKRS